MRCTYDTAFFNEIAVFNPVLRALRSFQLCLAFGTGIHSSFQQEYCNLHSTSPRCCVVHTAEFNPLYLANYSSTAAFNIRVRRLRQKHQHYSYWSPSCHHGPCNRNHTVAFDSNSRWWTLNPAFHKSRPGQRVGSGGLKQNRG